ncbi:hypothetical protein H2201_005880 [Coniosporium apollinis]|uniref:Nephrocystin 3-like N-terminal domain-containing protein n=1 Tax=Coniosporium apollinis TaxID=61459 RepID=A0ABQ9NQC4_9PEZI|nr:hypothetical protein H2201_005880 [Coniosporium apollinis]
MASIVIEHLLRSFPDNDIAVAYVYYVYKEQHKAEHLVAALLKQLVEQLPTLPEAVQELYKHHKKHNTLPTLEDLSEVLHPVASSFSQVFVVIDALDECREEDDIRTKLLGSIKEIILFTNTLVTSRPIPAIENAFEKEPREEIRAINEDITTCLEAKMMKSWLSYQVSAQPSLRAEIVRKVVARAIWIDVDLNKEVTIDTESNIIRLVHYTAQEYFERTREKHLPDGPKLIASACLTYLSFDAFSEGHCRSNQDLESRLAEYPLLPYSAEYWADHAREDIEESILNLAVDFLAHEPKVTNAIQAASNWSDSIVFMPRLTPPPPEYSQHFKKGITDLRVAAFCGLLRSFRCPGDHGADVDARDETGMTALREVCLEKHGVVAQPLLAAGVNTNAQSKWRETALYLASSEGHEDVVRLLLDRGANVNARAQLGGTALHAGSTQGHEKVVRLLLEKGADIDAKNAAGNTALQDACWHRRLKIVQLLLDNGANEILQMLLEHGADARQLTKDTSPL